MTSINKQKRITETRYFKSGQSGMAGKASRTLVDIMMGILVVYFLFPVLLCGGAEVIEKATILKTSPEWQSHYDDFVPDETLLPMWQAKIGKNLAIDVYLGTWCSDSKKNVPPFMKLLDSLGQEQVVVNYYNVPRKASADVKYFVEELKVERVPTFIFYRDGQEIGRIVENPQKSLLEDFIEIIF